MMSRGPILKILPALLPWISLLLITIPAASGYWSEWRGDPLHQAVEEGLPTGIGELIWKYNTNGQVYSSPVFYPGGMLIGSDDWNLYCLDPDSGQLNWKFKTEGEVQSTPYIENGRAYFGSFDGNLYCLELPEDKDGRPTLLWSKELEGDVISSCHPYKDSMIVADTGGFVHRITKEGNTVWNVSHSNHDYWSSPIVDAENERGIIGDEFDNLVIFSLEDGSLIKNISYGESSELYSSGLLNDDILYITDGEGRRLIAEDLSGEGRGWTFDIGYPSYSTPVINGDRIYFGSFEFAWCLPLDDPDGSGIMEMDEIIWSHPTHDFQGGSSPLIAGDLMFIGSDDYNLYCLDKWTGEEQWTFPTNGYVYSSPALKNGSVYFGSNDRSVYCVGERPPGIELEVTMDPLEITTEETARIWINVTDGDGNLVQNSTLSIDTSAGFVTYDHEHPLIGGVVLGPGWTFFDFVPFFVSSRSTIDITIKAEKEGLTMGFSTIQLIVEPGQDPDEDTPEVIDRAKERRPYIIGLILVVILNLSLLLVLVLFKIRDFNTPREATI